MRVLVECSADETTLRTLGVPRKSLLHFGGKDKLINRLKDLPDAIGIVDEDPGSTQHPDITSSYHQCNAAEGLRLLERQGKGGQKLVVICPRLEDWLIQRAKLAGMSPGDYGLPDTAKRLHGIPRYEQRDGFKRFLTALIDRDRGMELLREWVLSSTI